VATCSVDGCERPLRYPTLGLCQTHYFRLRRQGDVQADRPVFRKGGMCSVKGCEAPVDGRELCGMHYTRWLRHGNPETRLPTVAERPMPKKEDSWVWKGDDITISGSHMRTRALKGPARTYLCIECGERPAQHWSYEHGCSSERVDPERGPYCPHPEHYSPRCVSCHKVFDLRRLQP
jgi:hypothetical protein